MVIAFEILAALAVGFARAKWTLKARNARDRWHLEIPAVQLITPNLPDAAHFTRGFGRGCGLSTHCYNQLEQFVRRYALDHPSPTVAPYAPR